MELTKTFESLSFLFKKQIFKYQDELTVWLMMEMNKIDYFRPLSLQTKQELIYSMERFTFEKGSRIQKKDEPANKMFLI
jgi:quercetin dioxygenase-like cupin family protein